MSEQRVRDKLARVLPEWVGANVTAMEQGQSEQCFVLCRNRDKALIKLDTTARPDFLISRKKEAAVQMVAAEQGIAPTVLFADAHCIVTEFRAARHLPLRDFHRQSILKRLGKLLRKLHALPTIGHGSNMPVAAEYYAASLSPSAVLSRALSAVHSLTPSESPVLSHGDVVTGNVIDDGNLLMIDWEYASDRSPLFDLATVIAHHELGLTAAKQLLDAYEPGGIDERELAGYVRAYHALHWLWLANRQADPSRLAKLANHF